MHCWKKLRSRDGSGREILKYNYPVIHKVAPELLKLKTKTKFSSACLIKKIQASRRAFFLPEDLPLLGVAITVKQLLCFSNLNQFFFFKSTFNFSKISALLLQFFLF